MNREERLKILAESLNNAARAEKERQDQAKQVDRITAAVKAKLAHRLHAEAGDLQCPQCGYTGPEDSFDEVDESDGYSTDPETSETGGDDIEELDAAGKKRVVAELLKNRRR